MPSITIIGISRKYTALTGAVEYTHLTKTVNFTGTQGSIVGDAGVFLAGPAETETWPANLVVDLDNVCVWSAVKEVATIRIMLEETSTSQGDFATGLVSQFVFDDGGVTAEDIIVQEDWWTKWRHAGVMTETGPGLSDAIGRGMILDPRWPTLLTRITTACRMTGKSSSSVTSATAALMIRTVTASPTRKNTTCQRITAILRSQRPTWAIRRMAHRQAGSAIGWHG